ncbi:ABC transporter permease [Salibacterium aidingense]|uniref:ABC transporter permease n=1 Tax=Salibacterium aidingense TaxID=384933 RepID=UPI003BD9AC2E
MAEKRFNNTLPLLGMICRQERLQLPLWLAGLAGFTLIVAISFTNLYTNERELQEIAQSMINPAVTALVGPGYGIDNYTYGAMMAHQMLGMTALITGIMNILLITRHTRANEEDGRLEMIRSLPTGRLSNIGAAMLTAVIINLLLAVVIGFGLYTLQIESMEWEGSLLYGAALGAIGLFFAAVTGLLAQLSESARGVTGFSIGILLLAYAVRAIGDVSNETLSWFSPFGWVLGTEAYVNNYWWPIAVTLGTAVIVTVFAFYLNAIRDLEAGFFPSKPGRKHASFLLHHPFGLAFRLQRTGIIAWGAAMLMFGAMYGSVLGETESFFEEIDMLQEFIQPEAEYSITEQFLTMLMAVMAMASTIPGVMAMMRLKAEEKKERSENLLSLAVSRNKLMGSYALLALLHGFIMLSLAGLGMGLAGNAVMEESLSVWGFYEAAVVYLPAMWIMIGMALFFIGLSPAFAGVTWAYLLYSFIVVYLGGLFQFPDWVTNLTPFGHIPQLPVEDFKLAAAAGLTGIAIILAAAGFISYNRRDIEG